MTQERDREIQTFVVCGLTTCRGMGKIVEKHISFQFNRLLQGYECVGVCVWFARLEALHRNNSNPHQWIVTILCLNANMCPVGVCKSARDHAERLSFCVSLRL